VADQQGFINGAKVFGKGCGKKPFYQKGFSRKIF
jgi:hypothetical protein